MCLYKFNIKNGCFCVIMIINHIHSMPHPSFNFIISKYVNTNDLCLIFVPTSYNYSRYITLDLWNPLNLAYSQGLLLNYMTKYLTKTFLHYCIYKGVY